jgi:hypothetical protein
MSFFNKHHAQALAGRRQCCRYTAETATYDEQVAVFLVAGE